MEKLIYGNLSQLFEENHPDPAVRHILNTGISNLQKKDFVRLLAYLLRIVHPEGYEKLVKIKSHISKADEHRYRGNVCALLSEISEMYPEAPPLPNVLPSHLIHPVGDNITCLLWKLSMIALITCLQKNNGIEVEKCPSGDNIPRNIGNYFAQLAIENEAAIDNCEQEKEAILKMFMDEYRGLQTTIETIKQETVVLKEILKDHVNNLSLDEALKSQLADLNTKPSFTAIEASLEERFKEVETILSSLELYPGLLENCRTLLEYHECQKVSPVYLCGEQLRNNFPHLRSFQDDELSLENILEQFSEKLEIALKELVCFKILCEEHQVEIKLDNALSQLNIDVQEAAECRLQLEEIANTYKDKYWAAMVPLLKNKGEECEKGHFFELCSTVSELACLPPSNFNLPSPTEKVEYQGSRFKKDWFKHSDIPVAAPNYMYYFEKPKISSSNKCGDSNPCKSSSRGELHGRLPFSTIKKQHYHPGLRLQERIMHASFSPSSPFSVKNGNESFPDVKFPKCLEKQVRKVLVTSEMNCPDAYTSTPPPRYSGASEGSDCQLSQISMPSLNFSGSSDDSDRLGSYEK